MRPGSRVLNRGVLLLCGLVLAAAGSTAVLAGTSSGWAGSWPGSDPVGAGLSQVRAFASGLPPVQGASDDASGVVLVALAVAVLLTVLLVVFVTTRRSGRTTTVLRLEAERGSTVVDRNVAEELFSGELGERPDVLSARTRVYRVRGAEVIELAVTVRRGADLSRVLSAAEDAVAAWDVLAGVRVPVVVHLSDRSWLDGLRTPSRVR